MPARAPSPNAQFTEFLSRFPAEIVARVKQSLPKLRRAFPGATQLVYDYRNSLVVSFAPDERGYEGIVALAVDPRRVRLYFRKDVPDPKGRLEGAGSKVRSVALEAASDLDRGDIHELLQAAVRHAKGTLPRTRTTRMVIKSGAAKKTTAKTKSAKRTGRA